MTSKLDMENVRASLERNFIGKCFKDFVFCPNSNCLIMKYNSTISYSILVNWTPKVFIKRYKD